jgi:hypothetical protein
MEGKGDTYPSNMFATASIGSAGRGFAKAERYGRNDSSSRGAALLLMEISKIASSEVGQIKPPRPSRPSIIASGVYNPKPSSQESPYVVNTPVISVYEYAAEPNVSAGDGSLRPRNRTVSMDSMHHLIPVSPRYDSEVEEDPISSVPFVIPLSPSEEPRPSFRKKNFVGTTVHSRLKGVLRKKYAWREFPELEGYLIENRDQYLSFSSQLNYTAEQKRYNNRLTQGLLDLAAESGYKFEGFTFAMIRDRIRCYYKSYVQAVKKKKRKKRH